VPFRHGMTDVVKQCATLSSTSAAHPLRQRDPDALKREMLRHIDDDGAMTSVVIGLQFLDTHAMTYRESARRKASGSRMRASNGGSCRRRSILARLTLLPKSRRSPQGDTAIYFDVTEHALPDSAPLGSINRARWRAEAASRKPRVQDLPADARQQSRVCPR
jgi:hypothetical protein